MKKYLIPETTSLSVNAQTFLCGSETPAPTRSGELGTMKVANVAKW